MTDNEQQIAIAREMDFYILEDEGGACSLRHGRETTRYPWYDTAEEAWADSPDYLNDLNAMADAELHLMNQFKDDWSTYWRYLARVQPHPIFATARQRAEAFLRTIGKWKE